MRRREFIRTTAAGAAAIGCSATWPWSALAEPPPETTKLRLALGGAAICFAPQYVAGEGLLQAEGFTNIEYVKAPVVWKALGSGELDMTVNDPFAHITAIDKEQPIVVLAGIHVRCYELFGTDRVRTIHDLKGKKVAIPGLHTGRHLMMSTLLAHVGLDPRRDVE